MAALSISKAWDEAKDRISADGRLMTTVAAALLLLPQAVVALVAPPSELSGVEAGATTNLVTLIATLLGIAGQIAIILIALGRRTTVGDAISHGFKRLLPAFGAALLVVIGLFIIAVPVMLALGGTADLESAAAGQMARSVAIAVLVILVLAIAIAPKLLMMMPVATAEPGGPIHILKRSWALSAGHYFRLLGFMLLILVAAMVIIVAVQFVVGALLAGLFGDLSPMSVGALIYGLVFGACQALFAVVVSTMLARIYVQLAGGDAAEASVPKSGT